MLHGMIQDVCISLAVDVSAVATSTDSLVLLACVTVPCCLPCSALCCRSTMPHLAMRDCTGPVLTVVLWHQRPATLTGALHA